MTLQLLLDGGGEASLLTTDGNFVTLRTTRAAPPGTPLRGMSTEGETYQLKVRSCRRDSDSTEAAPHYLVDGRWVNLSRPQRERLLGT